jgi:hypothetical protein
MLSVIYSVNISYFLCYVYIVKNIIDTNEFTLYINKIKHISVVLI